MTPALAGASYRLGLAAGIALGRQLEGAERDEAWNRIAGPISRIDPLFMRKRWAVRGELRDQAEFGKPHPLDFPGRDAA